MIPPVRRTSAPFQRRVPLAALGAALLLLPACGDQEPEGTALAAADAGEPQPAPPVIPVPATPYTAGPVANGGTVTGVVRVSGELPGDTTVRPTMDTRACGASFVDRTIVRTGDRLGGAVVWLTDVRAGKPLPLRRRFEVTNARCQLAPRVQAVVAGGTLNVRSSDAVLHRTRIERHGAGEVVARIQHNDFGQVVPHDAGLRQPGLLELRSDVHPWTRGFVAVFDHPYFDVSAPSGAFTLTDVPPGTYTVAVWHERFGRHEQPVTVQAGATATVTLAFGDAPVAADSAASGARSADTATRRTARAPAGRTAPRAR